MGFRCTLAGAALITWVKGKFTLESTSNYETIGRKVPGVYRCAGWFSDWGLQGMEEVQFDGSGVFLRDRTSNLHWSSFSRVQSSCKENQQ